MIWDGLARSPTLKPHLSSHLNIASALLLYIIVHLTRIMRRNASLGRGHLARWHLRNRKSKGNIYSEIIKAVLSVNSVN